MTGLLLVALIGALVYADGVRSWPASSRTSRRRDALEEERRRGH